MKKRYVAKWKRALCLLLTALTLAAQMQFMAVNASTAGISRTSIATTQTGTVANTFQIEKLSYSFSNSAQDFSYTDGYQIPLSRFYQVFGKNPTAKMLFLNSYDWMGNCFGMTVSAVLLFGEKMICRFF